MSTPEKQYAPVAPDQVSPPAKNFKDPASYSEPSKFFTDHIHLNLRIDHNARKLTGSAHYTFRVLEPEASKLVLDIRGIRVFSVTDPVTHKSLKHNIIENVSAVGGTLTIDVSGKSDIPLKVAISYESDGCGGGASAGGACDWLSPAQAGGNPFMFTQAQAIHARSLFPCQDTPAVKAPYTAVVSVEQPYESLCVVMSAQHVASEPSDPKGSKRFHCAVPIPSYLFALACGTLEDRDLSPRCRVWALPEVVDKAAWEFEEVETMLSTAEKVAGPYVWGRYDLLVLPGSFPYGGMENPMLTFVTPTLLAVRMILVLRF